MDTNSNSKNDVGVILVGHGSRLPYGKDVLSQLAEIYKKNTEYPVEIGFMNMSKPSIPTSINKLSDMGVKKIVVTPVFLADGVHTTQDIPRILGLDNGNENMDHHHHHEEEVEHVHFHGEIIYTKPLGADSRIADIIKDRVDNAL
jgi:sirohydrochlorin cobaltochelatase